MLYRRGLLIGKTNRGKGSKIKAITVAGNTLLSTVIFDVAPHEIILGEHTLEDRFVEALPEKLIGDKAYDSNK
jgi:hypothetical protein